MAKLIEASWKDALLHIILPNQCMFCGVPIQWNEVLCEACETKMPWTDLSRCLICEQELCCCDPVKNGFSWLVAPFYYDLGVDKAVRDLKFNSNLLNARKLAFHMADCLRKTGLHRSVDCIIPVPLYESDYRNRGYNQAEELSKWIGRLLKLPLCGTLEKIRKTPKQHTLSAQERNQNLRGAFRVARPQEICGKRILLIDDVFTTGSTVRECSLKLKKAGARSIICLTAARTVGKETQNENVID